MDSWLKVLVPITGLAGVLIGAWVTTRAQSRAWLKDKQLVTYRDFIVAANDAIDFFATSVRAVVREGAKLSSVSTSFGEKVAALLVLYHVIQLIGPPAVINAAADIKDAVDEALMLLADAGSRRIPYTSSQWDTMIERLRSAQTTFPSVARQDLRGRLRRERAVVDTWTIDQLRSRVP